MKKRTYEDRLHLDMPFSEALERFAGTSPKEMRANIDRAKKKKPPGGKRRKPSGGRAQGKNVVPLRGKRSRD
jgi:hypothetical protein